MVRFEGDFEKVQLILIMILNAPHCPSDLLNRDGNLTFISKL